MLSIKEQSVGPIFGLITCLKLGNDLPLIDELFKDSVLELGDQIQIVG